MPTVTALAPSLASLCAIETICQAPEDAPLDLVVYDGRDHILLTADNRLPRAAVAIPGRELFAIADAVQDLAPQRYITDVVPVQVDPSGITVSVHAAGRGGRFVAVDELGDSLRGKVEQALAARRLSPLDVLAEIEAAAANPLRQRFHRTLIRPLLSPFSSALLRKRVLARVRPLASILDVSCGDDRLILQLARRGHLCVANDVSLAAMRTVARADRSGRITFTLQSAAALALDTDFDFVICKNTLHHLDDHERRGLFDYIREHAAEAILLDVVDVSTSRRARIFNAYYRVFLGDCGATFLRGEEIGALAQQALPGWMAKTERIETLKGRYVLIHLTRPPGQP